MTCQHDARHCAASQEKHSIGVLLLTNGHSLVDGLAHGFQLHRRASLLLQTMTIKMTPTSLASHEDGGNAHATLQISACLCEAAYRQQTRCIRNIVACLAWPSDTYLHLGLQTASVSQHSSVSCMHSAAAPTGGKSERLPRGPECLHHPFAAGRA